MEGEETEARGVSGTLYSQLGFPEPSREGSAPENVASWGVSSLPRLAWASWRLQKQTDVYEVLVLEELRGI